MGHSYFAESRSVLSDIFYLIRKGQRAEQRFASVRLMPNQVAIGCSRCDVYEVGCIRPGAAKRSAYTLLADSV